MNSSALLNSLDIFAETYKHLRDSYDKLANIEDLKAQWARKILKRLNVDAKVIGQPTQNNSVIYVGNHISYLDIPLMMAHVPRISFVAKQELSSWPIFGSAARRIDTVFVKRENGGSRRNARQQIQNALEHGRRVIIFPSGTTCISESKNWRKGAFEIARDLGVYVQPFRISYSPLRDAAYIDRDFFPLHLYKLSQVPKVTATLEFHDLARISDATEDCLHWQKWSKGLLDASGK